MQVQNIQSNSFKGVYIPQNFNPTTVQVRMVKTIRNKFAQDSVIYRKGKNFHDFLEKKGKHLILANGDYKDEVKIGIGFINSDGGLVVEHNCGSYSENRLDSIVQQTKNAWREHKMNTLIFYVISGAIVAYILGMTAIGRK